MKSMEFEKVKKKTDKEENGIKAARALRENTTVLRRQF
jgi:hypothetical protein